MKKRQKNGVASIYLACRAMLVRAVRGIVFRHDVEDMLQGTFVRRCEAEGRHVIRDARSFLLHAARNAALDHVSSARYRRAGSLESMDEPRFVDESATAEARGESERRFLEICEAVGVLPEQCSRVFVLRKVYRLTQDEVATRLGITQTTVEKHIAKGLLLCQEHMALNAQRQQRGKLRSR